MVVLPLVPVTPISRSLVDGRPYTAAAAGAISARTDATRTWGAATSTKRSTNRAAAPADTAAGAWSWPSVVLPGTQQKRAPAVTWRLSWVTEVTLDAEIAADLDGGDRVADLVEQHARNLYRPGAGGGDAGGAAGVAGGGGTAPRVAGGWTASVVGGGIRMARRAYCMIREKTGAATCPP